MLNYEDESEDEDNYSLKPGKSGNLPPNTQPSQNN